MSDTMDAMKYAATAARPFVGVDLAKGEPTYTCVKIAPGNAAAMREALEKVKKLNRYDLGCIRSRKRRDEFDAIILKIERTVRAALSAPARNCDVGTAEEQQNRFREFCRLHDSKGECGIGRSEAACPAFHGWRNPDCSLWWAQMPYENKEESNG